MQEDSGDDQEFEMKEAKFFGLKRISFRRD
jgi:hypothetical protein